MRFLAAVLLFSASAFGQLPDAPKPVGLRTERILFAMDAAARGMDVYTSQRAKQNPLNYEANLPTWAVKNAGVQIAVEAGIGITLYGLARFFDRAGHHKVALAIPIIDMTATAFTDYRNMQLSPRKVHIQ